ncbi:MAG: peroxide stress protein YaaA [Pseudomonadaceae bacterium]|nr:peroxide stress protein YaaA [Pseudomonadaceae bacterium]
MLAIISPAKTLDFESKLTTRKGTTPEFVEESDQLIHRLRQYEPKALTRLMKISDNLAELNHRRYHEWTPDFEPSTARPAALAFKGDVYLGLQAQELSERDLTWAQKHLRILSGLHGLLKPLDRIHPYRLEMGTPLCTEKGKNLYDFWGDKVTRALNEDLAAQSKPLLVNLASQEYFNVIDPNAINAEVINIHFKEEKDGKLKFLSFYAKKARGLMARYMIDKRVKTQKALKAFDYEGYTYNEALSSSHDWVFSRPQPAPVSSRK